MTLSSENVLTGAIDYLHEHGWCRLQIAAPDGHVCLVGAIYGGLGLLETYKNHLGQTALLVGPSTPRQSMDIIRAQKRVARVLRREYGWNAANHVWNDHMAQDIDEVIGVLKLALDEEEE